jgi:DNA polymerase III delta prime subunit
VQGHPDLCDVVGQEGARRALEIAAGGGHNLLLWGPPGTGKTLLACRHLPRTRSCLVSPYAILTALLPRATLSFSGHFAIHTTAPALRL